MQKVLHCDCGFEARGDDEVQLVDQIQRHALEAHGMELTRAQVRVLASRAEPAETIPKEET